MRKGASRFTEKDSLLISLKIMLKRTYILVHTGHTSLLHVCFLASDKLKYVLNPRVGLLQQALPDISLLSLLIDKKKKKQGKKVTLKHEIKAQSSPISVNVSPSRRRNDEEV